MDKDSISARLPRDMRRRNPIIGLLLFLSLAGFAGCHGSWPFAGSHLPVDNVQFMDAWNTYIHCRSSSEPEEIRADLQQLTHLAKAETMRSHASRLLSTPIRSLIAPLPSRLAVDPQSMMAACALHGGRVAHHAGHPNVSEELLSTVAEAAQDSVSADDTVEASRRQTRLNEEIPVTWQRPHAPILSSNE